MALCVPLHVRMGFLFEKGKEKGSILVPTTTYKKMVGSWNLVPSTYLLCGCLFFLNLNILNNFKK
jgi:hypothetical protein